MATGQQPAAEAVHAAAASADECPDRARAIAAAACRGAVAELEFRTYVPQFIKDMGGYNAPVIVPNLVVGDGFPVFGFRCGCGHIGWFCRCCG